MFGLLLCGAEVFGAGDFGVILFSLWEEYSTPTDGAILSKLPIPPGQLTLNLCYTHRRQPGVLSEMA
jgi:hypothetical protein